MLDEERKSIKRMLNHLLAFTDVEFVGATMNRPDSYHLDKIDEISRGYGHRDTNDDINNGEKLSY